MKTRKISVLSPIALTEPGSALNDWRSSANHNALLRSRWMLQSFLDRFDQSVVERFVVVCPDQDRDAIEEMIREVTRGVTEASHPTVLTDSAFFQMCGWRGVASADLTGWQIQQIVKLGFSRICETDFYLTIDSDIVQFRDAGLPDLFPDGEKALIGVETAADYDRIYSAEFSVRERQAKQQYYESSQVILGYRRPAGREDFFFSETPVVLNRSRVMAMLDHIEAVHAREIAAVLSEYPGWTEYSLYFQFLEMTDALAELYVCGGCNAVLSVEKSVWQPNACYKSQRFYDRLHFAGTPLSGEGPFIAIQSWIPLKEWLPVKFGALADFYRHLESWLDPSSPQAANPGSAQEGALEPVNPAAFLRILEKVDPSSTLYRRSREVLEGSLEKAQTPKATPPGEPKFLTIGMATHNDYDGCYFTIQAIRLYHPEILNDVEFLVIDNDPAGPCANALKILEHFAPNYRYVPHRSRQGSAVRDLVFREAAGEFVLCIDCHVFFPPGALARLIDYCRRNPDSNDLLQGPVVSDAFEPMATHFDPEWSDGMYGIWGMDQRGKEIDAEPFEVAMQGLGVFACRRENWPGFNPRLAGFGAEEGYLHEKIRRAGGRTLCLPFLRWMHRFERPLGVPYRPDWADRIRNYLLIHQELNQDPAPMIRHFEELIGEKQAGDMVWAAHAEMRGPFHFFDAIYCVNLDRQTERWQEMQRRFRGLGIDRAVRRFPAANTPLNHHIGCALSHRRIVAEAKQQQLKTVLVFEDDARFSADAAEVLALGLGELNGLEWQLLYLGGYRSASSLENVPGCRNLLRPGVISCTHAIAYHHTVYDAILEAVPDNAVDIALWLRTHLAIDKFYNRGLEASSFLIWPVIATQETILLEEARAFND